MACDASGEWTGKQDARRACKPDFVQGVAPSGWPFLWTRGCPRASSCQPGCLGQKPNPGVAPATSLFGIAPGGACRAAPVTRRAVGSYPTVSPLPRPEGQGGFISVALSVGSLRPGVTRHRGLVESGLSSNGCPPAAIQPSAHPSATRGRRRVQALTRCLPWRPSRP